MLAPVPGKCVRKDSACVKAALRKPRRAAEVEPDILHRDLWQRVVVGHTILDAKTQRVLRRVGYKCDSDPVESNTCLVDHVGREDVDFVDGADLPMRSAVISETGNGIALQVRLGARVLLPCIVGVHIVFSRKGMEQIAGELIGLHRPRR